MRPYSILDALPPEDFLKPENFVTDNDHKVPEFADDQYQEGLRISREHSRVIIRANSTWAAESRLKAEYSYEGIGYHGHTASLLRGFLDGPAPIDVERRQEDYSVTTTRIKEATE
jgi:hypothetical protein